MTPTSGQQLCFPGLKPSKPTIRTPRVAERIAKRIVAAVNLDEFYWESSEIPDRVFDVAQEIMCCGRPATVFGRLQRKSPPVTNAPRSERVCHPYGWEGIDEHCREIADEIETEELRRAIGEWQRYRESGT